MSTLFKCRYVLFLYYSVTVTLIRNEFIMEVSLQPVKRNLFAKSLFDLTTVNLFVSDSYKYTETF